MNFCSQICGCGLCDSEDKLFVLIVPDSAVRHATLAAAVARWVILRTNYIAATLSNDSIVRRSDMTAIIQYS